MPTQENSSAGNTFSMSRWAMTLPIVARRSPAITTPPEKVAATIVVPCGVSPAASPSGSDRRVGSSSGAWSARKSAKEDEPGTKYDDGRLPPRGVSLMKAYSPPFWMNDFTKSSALVSRTSSMSSRIASMSSSSCSLRSETASAGAGAASAGSSSSWDLRGCFCSCAMETSCDRTLVRRCLDPIHSPEPSCPNTPGEKRRPQHPARLPRNRTKPWWAGRDLLLVGSGLMSLLLKAFPHGRPSRPARAPLRAFATVLLTLVALVVTLLPLAAPADAARGSHQAQHHQARKHVKKSKHR